MGDEQNPQIRTRSVDFEVIRAAEDGDGLTLEGYAAVFNSPTLIDSWEGRFTEVIAPGAFKRTIGQKGTRGIKLQFDHGHHPMVGSMPLGTIEELREDDRGLFVRARLLSNWMVEPIRDAIAAGAVDGMSFRFRVLREDVDAEPDPPLRTVREVELYELGPVVFPAYPATTVGVRSEDAEAKSAFETALNAVFEEYLRAHPHDTDAEPADGPSEEPAAGTDASLVEEPRSAGGQEPKEESTVFDIERYTSLEDLKARASEIIDEQTRMATEAGVTPFSAEDRAKFDEMTEELTAVRSRVKEVEERLAYIKSLGGSDTTTEPTTPVREATRWSNGPKPSRIPENIYDLGAYRKVADSYEDERTLLRDGAMRSVEGARFPHTAANREDVQEHIEHLLKSIDETGSRDPFPADASLAKRILITGAPVYKRALGKYIAAQGQLGALSPEEQRALSIGTGSAGGFAVVYTLDPSIVPTSNFSVNPWRALARIETISGTNEWKAVTSGAITAAYAAEVTEASDNAPTLAQPDIIVEKAQAYVPFSIEAGQDWDGLQTEMAGLLQDAKDDLEATQFATGAGHGSNAPKGVITGATNTTGTTTTATFVVADLYKAFEALPARFRPRAQFAANLFIIDKIRQFDTSGGSGVWMGPQGLQPSADAGGAGTIASSVGVPLLGRTLYEATAMASALTTTSKILLVGDFRYFVIVDRVGMNIEVLPLVVGTAHRPTGQRGLYAYWRNSSDVLSAAAFQVLVT